MGALAFFLNSVRGEVAWMDSLSMEWYWGWLINEAGLSTVLIEKEQSRIRSASSPAPEPPRYHQKKLTIPPQISVSLELL
ncbi:MAG: hypothetical protein RIG77_04540 [Cyclobacteriaceae bacterium]